MWQLLDNFEDLEMRLEDPDFDPATFVGEVDATKANIAAKVDACETTIFNMKAMLKRNEERAGFWQCKAEAVENNMGRLKSYLRDQLQMRGYEHLMGNDFVMKLQRNSNPSLKGVVDERDPTPADMLAFGPEVVVEIPTHYLWNREALKEELLARFKRREAGEQVPVAVIESLGRIEYGHHVAFPAADSPKYRKKNAGKK